MSGTTNAPLRTIRSLQPGRFAVGQPVSRQEDPVLLRGQGRYTDDLNLPGQAHAVVVRSRIAHGVLNGIDTDAARAMPGVLAVITAAELKAAGIGPMPANVTGQNWDGRPTPKPAQWALAEGRVRYVGDPLAVVVATSAMQARDAAEAVLPDIAPLPAVTEAAQAAAPGAPVLHAEAPDNIVLDWRFGDMAQVEAAFAAAAHRVELRIRNSRIVVAAMEPRSAIGEYDAASGRWTLRTGCQGAFGMRATLRGILGAAPGQVRVLTGHVGGSFGMKASVYPEYIAVLHAARALGRPVKWTDERSDSFLSDSHGRDHDHTLALALDEAGHFLALRITGCANVGAYLSNSTTLPPTMNIVKNMVGVYRTPLLAAAVRCLFTNTTPVGPYRGAGRPEGNYYMERLVDTAARRLGIDRVELRRRNHITPAMIPYTAPSTMQYDSGDFPAILDRALTAADWDGFARRRADSRRRGRLRGRGIGHYLEVTAPATSEMGGIRFEPDGTVSIVTGTLDYGQGHWTPFAQVLVDLLGVPFERIRLVQGDSDQLLAGGGTGGSRSIMNSGAAILAAGAEVIARGRRARGTCAGSGGGGYRVRRRPFQHRRHRPRHRADGAGGRAAQAAVAAGRCAGNAGRFAGHARRAQRLPQRLPRRRSGGGAGHRPGGGGEIPHGQRFRGAGEPRIGGRPGAWRHRAGDRPGVVRKRPLRRHRTDPVRQLHGLRAAARRRCAGLHLREPSGPGHHQSARRQGLRRGGLRRQPARGDERAGRCAGRIRHRAHRHAGDAAGGLGGHRRGRTVVKRRRHGATGAVKITDVAAAAGVAAMTVSRVLNNPERVAPLTAARVHEAIERLGYVPNLIAGSLSSRRSRMIAAIVPTIASPMFSDPVQAFTDVMNRAGYHVLLALSGYGAGETGRELIRAVLTRRPDGLLLTGAVHPPGVARLLRDAAVPVVEIWDAAPAHTDMLVGFDHAELGAAVAAFFAERGHTRFAVLAAGNSRAALRRQGFAEEVARRGGRLVAEQSNLPAPSGIADGRAGLRAMLPALGERTALFCGSDLVAFGALTEARALGIAVPERLAICGFGDFELSRASEPPITSVSVDGTAMGRLAAENLLARLAGNAAPSRVLVPFRILPRATT